MALPRATPTKRSFYIHSTGLVFLGLTTGGVRLTRPFGEQTGRSALSRVSLAAAGVPSPPCIGA